VKSSVVAASRLMGAVAVMLMAIGLARGETAKAGGAQAGASYVALGDSYASGEGLGPFESGTDVKKGAKRNTCHRSAKDAYADLVPAVVLPGVRGRAFWACSGATTSDMEKRSGYYGQPKQTATVTGSTHWISVSVGGDDLHFGDLGKACGGVEINHKSFDRLPGEKLSCAQEIARQSRAFGGVRRSLAGLYRTLLNAAPAAGLVVVGYPRIFPRSYSGVPSFKGAPYCVLDHYPIPFATLDVGMPVADAKALDAFEVALNRTAQQAVGDVIASDSSLRGRIAFADTYSSSVARNCKGTAPNASVAGLELSAGHGVGSWVKSFISSATFHPTKAGQRMMAGVVQAAFTKLTGLGSVSLINPGDQTSSAGTRTSLQIHANATDGGAVTYAASGLPTGLAIDSASGLISGTSLTPGTTTVTITATETGGTHASITFHWTISAPADPFLITSGVIHPETSADGRFVSYWPEQGPNANQIVVLDRLTGSSVVASTTASGVPSQSVDDQDYALSQNGRYVLMLGDPWTADGVHGGVSYWVKDLATGKITYFGEGTAGASILGAQGVSDDGLVAAVELTEVHVRAPSLGLDATPTLCPGDDTGMPRITPDGRFVVFAEVFTHCTGQQGVHYVVYDRTSGAVSDVGFCTCNSPNSPGFLPRRPGISNDGRYVSFWTDAEPGHAPGIFVLDRSTGTTTGVPKPPGQDYEPYFTSTSLTGDGRLVFTQVSQGVSCVTVRATGQQSCYPGSDSWPSLSANGNFYIRGEPDRSVFGQYVSVG
jgi:hypothetical protein